MVRAVGAGTLDVRVRDLGGIERQEASFEPGVTVLVGRNATNRTSLLQSLGAALGGSIGALRGSADEGSVEMDLDGETYVREFHRTDAGSVRVDGVPYANDASVVDLFATLVEANPIRSAVERADGHELRALLMDPVDTEELTAQIESTRRELDSVEDRLDEIERQLGNLPALEQRRQQTATKLADVEDELAEVRATVDEYEVDAPDAAVGDDSAGASVRGGDEDDVKDDVKDDVVQELQSVREEYERVRDDGATQTDALESLEADLAAVDDELTSLDVPESEIEDVETELEQLRRRKRELSTTVSNLLSIVEFNEGLVDGSEGLGGASAGESGSGSGEPPIQSDDATPVDELDPSSQQLDCWTCGTSVERGQIGERLDDLRTVVDEKREERASIEAEIEAQRTALENLREHSDRRDELRKRRSEIESEIERRRERDATLEEREASLRDRIDELEVEAAEVEDRRTNELLEQSRRLSELEYERGQLEESLERLDDEIAAAEERSAERDRLETERDDLEEALASLRGRVEALEAAAVETFNEHVAAVIERLDYENVERVWLERKRGSSRDGSSSASSPRSGSDAANQAIATGAAGSDRDVIFDLHVVRAEDDGTVYEDTIDHLSESEREVIGLLVALAGYLVHDVYETVPVMVLDSLEAIDATRIATLVEYLADYAPYLVVALLPGDAEALASDYDRIEMGGD